jgi:hypothetical protein
MNSETLQQLDYYECLKFTDSSLSWKLIEAKWLNLVYKLFEKETKSNISYSNARGENNVCEHSMFHVVPGTGIRSFIQILREVGGGVFWMWGFYHNLEHRA